MSGVENFADELTVATRGRIVVASELILEALGLPELVLGDELEILDGDPIELVAGLPIAESEFAEVLQEFLTTLTISKPLGVLAIHAIWMHSIRYNLRGRASRHVTLYKGDKPRGRIDDPDPRTDPRASSRLTEGAARKVADDLERLSGALPRS